jgi:DNA polymerase III sliding clamp (beta) subunit (PCNA family)
VESKGSQGSNGVYIGFNGRYVLDTLGALSGDRVTLRFSGELDPCRIEDAALPGFVGVWMPMRI